MRGTVKVPRPRPSRPAWSPDACGSCCPDTRGRAILIACGWLAVGHGADFIGKLLIGGLRNQKNREGNTSHLRL
jgi:hypothetical protein